MNTPSTVSIILPARNEAAGLRKLLPELRRTYSDAEILVIDDGSTDDTRAVAEACGAKVISHPYSMGNGAAIKTGARRASGNVFVMMDADGQHDPKDIPTMLDALSRGHAMVVGARSAGTHASLGRRLANGVYNRLASYMTGQRIADLTSGFRAVRAKDFRRFLYLLPNGFSYPTTSTMAFFRSGLPVCYVPTDAARREGKSHIRITQDGLRFLVIILKIGTLFSPMRFFLPVSFTLFMAASLYYGFTFFTQGRFTNMSALLFTSSLLTFLIGILAELVSSLHYREARTDDAE